LAALNSISSNFEYLLDPKESLHQLGHKNCI